MQVVQNIQDKTKTSLKLKGETKILLWAQNTINWSFQTK